MLSWQLCCERQAALSKSSHEQLPPQSFSSYQNHYLCAVICLAPARGVTSPGLTRGGVLSLRVGTTFAAALACRALAEQRLPLLDALLYAPGSAAVALRGGVMFLVTATPRRCCPSTFGEDRIAASEVARADPMEVLPVPDFDVACALRGVVCFTARCGKEPFSRSRGVTLLLPEFRGLTRAEVETVESESGVAVDCAESGL